MGRVTDIFLGKGRKRRDEKIHHNKHLEVKKMVPNTLLSSNSPFDFCLAFCHSHIPILQISR